MRVKCKKPKKYKCTMEPKPLKSNWLKDDTQDTHMITFSYGKKYHRYIVIHNVTGVMSIFIREDLARKYAAGRNCSIIEQELTEDQAHEQHLKDAAERRWAAGYGA